jgi:hypothetical protein
LKGAQWGRCRQTTVDNCNQLNSGSGPADIMSQEN